MITFFLAGARLGRDGQQSYCRKSGKSILAGGVLPGTLKIHWQFTAKAANMPWIKFFHPNLESINAQVAAMAVKISMETILNIGRIVRFHRRRAGLSRIELATIAGVGKTVVYDIENGKETIRLNTLFKVLGALNVSLSLDSPLMDRYRL